jgi:hypothetical protein
MVVRRFPHSLLVLAGGLLVGAWLQQVLQRDARAQVSSVAATSYVPSDGLVFRSFDGRPLMRLTRDGRGGNLELYYEHEEVAVRLPGPGGLQSAVPRRDCDDP